MRDTIFLTTRKKFLLGENVFFFFFNTEWFANGIRSIKDLLDIDGHFVSFAKFQSKSVSVNEN